MVLLDELARGAMLGGVGICLALGMACNGPTPACDSGEDCTDPDPDSDSDTEPPPPEYFEPTAFFVTGYLGYDSNADQVRSYLTESGAQDPALVIEIAEEDYFINYDDRFKCTVLIQAAGTHDQAAWRDTAGAYIGFTMPATAATETDCADWDPTIWGDDPLAIIMQWGWGLGVAALDADVKTALKDAVDASSEVDWATDYEPYVVGGGVYWSALEGSPDFPGGFAHTNFTIGYEVDADFNLVFNGDEVVLLQAAAIANETASPPSGAYITNAIYGLNAEGLAGAR